MNTWDFDSEGCAVGPVVPVMAEGVLIATLSTLWDDVEGLQVHLADDGSLDALSGAQALALADALREVAGIEPPALRA